MLIGNVKILYFFLSDNFIFHEVFSTVELVSIFVISAVVITVALVKIREKNKQQALKE